MKSTDIVFTDELPVGALLGTKGYLVTEVRPSTRSGFSYLALSPDGTTVSIKEFFLADLCSRTDEKVTCKSTADTKIFSQLVKGFVKNANFLTSLQSDRVSNVLEVFQQNNTAYMVSEEQEGVVLEELIRVQGHSFKPGRIVQFADNLFKGLIEIHAFGMLHRDISPSNILITPNNGAVIVPDFGTFRDDKSKASKIVSSVLQSSQDYAPFELIFDDAEQEECSDLYCVASVIYELITGKKPARSLDRVAAVARGEDDPYVPLEGSIKGYKQKFIVSIDMALELFQEDRLQSASEYLMTQSNDEISDLLKMKSQARARAPKVGKFGFVSKIANLFLRK